MQRVARTYFTAENRLVLTIMPSARAAVGSGAMKALPRVAVVLRRCPRWLPALGAERAWPSEAPAAAAAGARGQVSALRDADAANGLQVVAVLHHEQPVVSMRMIVRAGSALDPQGQARARRPRGLAARPGHDDQVGAAS